MTGRVHELRGVRIIGRYPMMWEGRCGKHMHFTGPSYEVVEDLWRAHLYEMTGRAPKPTGDRSISRWQP